MPRIAYKDIDFRQNALVMIANANAICEEYAAQGYTMTLRSLYYQFVSRDLIPNNQREYDRLGRVINDARMAGMFDWHYLEDRTRNLSHLSHWDSPRDILMGAAQGYRTDKWANQPTYCEVWVEKDAVLGVVQGVCNELDVPYFSCRGYTSATEVWNAGQRLAERVNEGKEVVIFHLGDHDPSGIDMTRDIMDRINLFVGHETGATADEHDVSIRRLALNFNQVVEYSPPPNPAKVTDSRSGLYMLKYGESSWELDALEPNVMAGIIREAVESVRDDGQWARDLGEEARERQKLMQIAREYR